MSGKQYSSILSRQDTLPLQKDNGSSKRLPMAGCLNRIKNFRRTHLTLSTFVGACVFVLYHIVFCLVMGAIIHRPHATTRLVGVMAKSAAMGVIIGAPIYIISLSKDVPALYPSIDLFLAPLLAPMAITVDNYLFKLGISSTEVFLATFATLSGLGLMMASILIFLASRYKIFNLGSYLPYPVLCGFFSTMGVSLWFMAFAVDTNGKTVFQVFGSGNWTLIGDSLMHHLPSLCCGILMKWLGPKHPLAVSSLNVFVVVAAYVMLWTTGTTLVQAADKGWFWSQSQFMVSPFAADASTVSTLILAL